MYQINSFYSPEKWKRPNVRRLKCLLRQEPELIATVSCVRRVYITKLINRIAHTSGASCVGTHVHRTHVWCELCTGACAHHTRLVRVVHERMCTSHTSGASCVGTHVHCTHVWCELCTGACAPHTRLVRVVHGRMCISHTSGASCARAHLDLTHACHGASCARALVHGCMCTSHTPGASCVRTHVHLTTVIQQSRWAPHV